jgi:hypothetical protein
MGNSGPRNFHYYKVTYFSKFHEGMANSYEYVTIMIACCKNCMEPQTVAHYSPMTCISNLYRSLNNRLLHITNKTYFSDRKNQENGSTKRFLGLSVLFLFNSLQLLNC